MNQTGKQMNLARTRINTALRYRIFILRAAVLLACVCLNSICSAQEANSTPAGQGGSPKSGQDEPLTTQERDELLKLIRSLQERLDKLEAAQASGKSVPSTSPSPSPASVKNDPSMSDDPHVWMEPVVKEKPKAEAAETESYGRYTPNLGFKLANTEYGDLSISIYTYARYLNQRALNASYQDAFGNTKTVQQRQDFQLQKVQIKLLGWILNPKLRYFLYTWTSNPTQGQGAQVVVAGNLGYTFNKYITLAAGITSLPGVRSTEGNFPFWLGVDSRMIGDEFFRPSYTSGIWIKGNLTKRLRYQAMIGNNMSTLGVSAARLDNKFNTLATALVWTHGPGEYGQGFGDFEHHQKPAMRFAFHFTRSDENKESQPNSDTFENTQLRLSDGTVIFTPDLFGPGIAITDARYRMVDVDGGIKYRGFSLEGEYYWRWLDKFKFAEPLTPAQLLRVPDLFDHGFQLQAAAMLVPRTAQAYVGWSRINGQYGKPWDVRVGVNWFPWKNKVVRWNTEWLYLYKSPVGYSSVPFAIGGKGSVFHSSLELAF